MTSGIYAMELMDWMFGKITDISGRASKRENGMEYQYILTGETQTGVLFAAKNTTGAVLDNTCRIFGESGHIHFASCNIHLISHCFLREICYTIMKNIKKAGTLYEIHSRNL